MTQQTTMRSRKVAAIGLLMALLGTLAFLVVIPTAQHFQNLQKKIDNERILLGRLQSFVSKNGDTERQAEHSNIVIKSGIFLAGRTDALRAANLLTLVTQAAQDQGIRLRSTRTTATTEHGGLRLIGVQAVMTANIGQIQTLILAIESMQPYLFVQTIQIGQPTSNRSDDDKLQVRVGVIGAAPSEQG